MPLNKVDQLVKNAMLNYPSAFPDRLRVLGHLLLVRHNGYEWQGGELVAREKALEVTRPATEMSFVPLDSHDNYVHQVTRLAEMMFDGPVDSVLLDAHFASRKAAVDYENEVRASRARYIDHLAAANITDARISQQTWESFRFRQSHLSSIPYAALDSDWAYAVYELVSALKNRIFEHRIVTGKADKPLKGRYATLMAHLDAVLEGLEPKVQHKARTLRVARRAAGLSGVPNSAAEPCID